MIKAIICDVDGMLMTGEMFSTYLARKYGITKEKTDAFFMGEFQDCLIGKSDLKKILLKYISTWEWKKTIEDLINEWFQFEDRVDSELMNYLQIIREKGVKVYVATNQEKYRTDYLLKKMGFETLFDGVFSSAHLGYRKPNKQFFVNILEKMNEVKRDEILFWDDQQKNVDGAKDLGFNAELYSDFPNFKAVLDKYLRESVSRQR